MANIVKPAILKLWAESGSSVQPGDAKIEQGWIAEKPPFQTENWIQNRTDEYIKHIDENGIPEWLNTSEYRLGSLCLYLGELWQSSQAVNLNQTPTVGLGFWEKRDFLKLDGSSVLSGDLNVINNFGLSVQDTLGAPQLIAYRSTGNIVYLGGVTDTNALNLQTIIRVGGANRLVMGATFTWDGFTIWHSGNFTPPVAVTTTSYLGRFNFFPSNTINTNLLPPGWSVAYPAGNDVVVTHNLNTLNYVVLIQPSTTQAPDIDTALNSFTYQHPGTNNSGSGFLLVAY